MAFYTFLDWVIAGQSPADITAYLSVHRSELEPPDSAGMNAWHHAARGGWVGILRHLRTSGYANPDGVDREGQTAIHHLAQCRRPHVDYASGLDLLMELGVPIDALCEDGTTALCDACGSNNEDAFAVLLERGANPVVVGQRESPLHHSSISITNARRLIMHNPGVVNDTSSSTSPLDHAIFFGNVDLVIALCDMGARPTRSNMTSSVYNVVMQGNREMIIAVLRVATMEDMTYRSGTPAFPGLSVMNVAAFRCPRIVATMLAMFPELECPVQREVGQLAGPEPVELRYPTDAERREILYPIFFAQSLFQRLVVWT